MKRCRCPSPRARWYWIATFSAVSTASEPEPENMMRFSPAGVICATSAASRNATGTPNWNGGA